MDKSEAKKWVEENLGRLSEMYGLYQWRIVVNFEPLRDRAAGECHKDVEYEQAAITIDCEEIDDFKKLETIMHHELCHIVHSPFDLFWCSASAYFQDPASQDAMKTLWHKCQELTVRNLERMHAGHKEAFDADPT